MRDGYVLRVPCGAAIRERMRTANMRGCRGQRTGASGSTRDGGVRWRGSLADAIRNTCDSYVEYWDMRTDSNRFTSVGYVSSRDPWYTYSVKRYRRYHMQLENMSN